MVEAQCTQADNMLASLKSEPRKAHETPCVGTTSEEPFCNCQFGVHYDCAVEY